MERIPKALCMCIDLPVPLGAIGMVSRMLVWYVDGVFLMFRWVSIVCNVGSN